MVSANGAGFHNLGNVYKMNHPVNHSLHNDEFSKSAGHWPRVFTKEGIHPFDEVEWKIVDAEIRNASGQIKFHQENVEVPIWWSQNAVNVVADKYFRIINGVKENSVKQVFVRVAAVLTRWAKEQNFFNTEEDSLVYEDELIYALLHQYGAFNSPVWFNLGVPDRKQVASACFISGVDDTLESLMDFQKSEATIFAGGSGSGANLSKPRSSYERLSSGSYVSGLLSWMEVFDRGAKAMKSGGSTRNAAKMVVIDIDHPDIIETKDGRPGFIKCKAWAEKIAHDLINKCNVSAAYDDPNSAYKLVPYQNANHSVSVSDAFMQAVVNDSNWETRERVSGRVVHTYKARQIWKDIAEAAWVCGDPGIQFTDIINRWHTTPKAGRISASNPCSEFLEIDDSACNLCALNLTKFFDRSESGNFELNLDRFKQAARLFGTAQMAIVDKAEYPTEKIRYNSLQLRPIGINYGDLGALLMKLGYSYDSNEGRAVAARMASLMTGLTYLNAAMLASKVGPFPAYRENADNMLDVMRMHQKADLEIIKRCDLRTDPLFFHQAVSPAMCSAETWNSVIDLGSIYGFYISQASLQAPLGTISFLMGMDTTGIEPAFSLVSYKSLVGGGAMKLVNASIAESLRTLRYPEDQIKEICNHVEKNDYIESAPHLKLEHLPVFDCAMPSGPSNRYLSPMAHIKMMAAIQPLITCAQSKTVNLPNICTPEEIADIYMESWKLGIKCIALYRDGCKLSQPLSTKSEDTSPNVETRVEIRTVEVPVTKRRHMPENVIGHRHRLEIAGHKGYIMMNEYPDGTLGEVFLNLGKSGSTTRGLLDGFTQLLSVALQYGVPLDKLIRSFINTKFEPSGFTRNPEIRFAESLYDYLFKLLDLRYCNGENSGLNGLPAIEEDHTPLPETILPKRRDISSPPCNNCGAITQRNGSCYLCTTCGTTTGCS